MDGSAPKELNIRNYSLPIDWSRLTHETDSSLYLDRSALLNSMRSNNIAAGNMEAIGNLIDFVELTTSQCCQVLGIEDSPMIRVVRDQIINGEFRQKGGHYSTAHISNYYEKYDTWLIDISATDLEEIANWWESTTDKASSRYWRKYFEARLARTIAHETAHHKVAQLYPELDSQTIEAANKLREGYNISYREDPGEKLARDFDKQFLQERVKKWQSTQGTTSDKEFYTGDNGEYIEAWQGYLGNDYDREFP